MKPFNDNGTRRPQMNIGDHGFHGDVIIKCIEMPTNFESLPKWHDNKLALGEHTGHCHALVDGDFDLRFCPETKAKMLKIITPSTLKHQEHAPVVIPPGIYRIEIQKEYDHFEKISREVAD